jgi:hypothetical protein
MYITESRNILMTSTSLILKHVLLELNMIGGQIVRHLIITVKLWYDCNTISDAGNQVRPYKVKGTTFWPDLQTILSRF